MRKSLGVSWQTLQRLPVYLNYLKSLPSEWERISASAIAAALHLNDVQVRKDLACVSSSGRPKVGYPVDTLRRELEDFLGYHDVDTAVIVGAGHLGRALLNYGGFEAYGLKILAAFDVESTLFGSEGGKIWPLAKLGELCAQLHPKIGIITTPADAAQGACDLLVSANVKAIWNFAPVHLRVDEGIVVTDENMAVHLAILSHHLRQSPVREHFNQC